MRKLHTLIFIGLGLFMLSSCQPEEDNITDAAEEVTKVEDLIVNRRWKLIDLKCDKPIDFNHTGIPQNRNVHVYSQLMECQRDDFLYFFDNYTGVHDNGAQPCISLEKKRSAFNWGYSILNNQMMVDGVSWNLDYIDGAIMGVSYNHYDTLDLTYYQLSAIYARR